METCKEDQPATENEMVSEENIVWDTPENAKLDEMIMLATESGVPRQVVDCLLECGFDSIARVAILESVSEIEKFFRENSFLYSDLDRRRRLYGIFEKSPEKFVFLPGHRSSLLNFVEVCHGHLPENTEPPKSPDTAPATRGRPAANSGVGSSSSSGVATRWSSRSGNASTSSKWDSLSGSGGGGGSQNQVSTVSTTAEEIMKTMKRKFYKWCSGHPDAQVKRLQMGKDFRINILCSGSVSDAEVNSRPLPVSAFGVEIVCMICSGRVQLNPRNNTFVSSNATRHLYRCALGFTPRRAAPGTKAAKAVATSARPTRRAGGTLAVSAGTELVTETSSMPVESIVAAEQSPAEIMYQVSEVASIGVDEDAVVHLQAEPTNLHQYHIEDDIANAEAVYTVAEDNEIVDGQIYFIDEDNQLRKLNS